MGVHSPALLPGEAAGGGGQPPGGQDHRLGALLLLLPLLLLLLLPLLHFMGEGVLGATGYLFPFFSHLFWPWVIWWPIFILHTCPAFFSCWHSHRGALWKKPGQRTSEKLKPRESKETKYIYESNKNRTLSNKMFFLTLNFLFFY